jgi:3-methyladenine DNA glycosylase AlkD
LSILTSNQKNNFGSLSNTARTVNGRLEIVSSYRLLCYDRDNALYYGLNQEFFVNNQEARELGNRLALLVINRKYDTACDLLCPVLAERTPFRLLDAIGERLGSETPEAVNIFLDRVAAQRTMGGWVVIASALQKKLGRDLPGAFERSRGYVMAADTWYATDTFGERVPGPALVAEFEHAVAMLVSWREDSNRWVRRMVGVAIHFWAKRTKDKPGFRPQAATLLDLLDPMFTEREVDVIKGVGWGLKTLGKYYPDLVAEWLSQQAGRPHRALMLHKATLYLPAELRSEVIGKFQ